jgi:hypothetical protein
VQQAKRVGRGSRSRPAQSGLTTDLRKADLGLGEGCPSFFFSLYSFVLWVIYCQIGTEINFWSEEFISIFGFFRHLDEFFTSLYEINAKM